MIINIPGRPIPAVRMTQKSKWSKHAKRYLAYKEQIGYIALIQCHAPLENEIEVRVRVYLSGKKTPRGNDGDVDNYLKSALDGLNKIAWIDDKQVRSAHVEKIPCGENEQRMEIFLKKIV